MKIKMKELVAGSGKNIASPPSEESHILHRGHDRISLHSDFGDY
jgi:hypothetical protein